MKILNLYAGIGGNRKNWDGNKHDITAVETDAKRIKVYQDHFPEDTVIQTDAHQYLKENYMDYDFIWTSPPCPTHSKIRNVAGVGSGQNQPVYPDARLWQEAVFLKNVRQTSGNNWKGSYVVENVEPYYKIPGEWQRVHRHIFSANFSIPQIQLETDDIQGGRNRQKQFGYDLTKYSFDPKTKGNMLRDCVNPELGEAILNARNTKQTKLQVTQ